MWTDTERPILDAILDVLIPPSADGRVPGAGQAGVAGFLPQATLYADDPAKVIRVILAHIQDHGTFLDLSEKARVTVLKQAEATHPEAFATLVQLTYMGYYSRPDIRPLFGVGAHPVHPNGYVVAAENGDELAALTTPVRARGQAFRDPKAEQPS